MLKKFRACSWDKGNSPLAYWVDRICQCNLIKVALIINFDHQTQYQRAKSFRQYWQDKSFNDCFNILHGRPRRPLVLSVYVDWLSDEIVWNLKEWDYFCHVKDLPFPYPEITATRPSKISFVHITLHNLAKIPWKIRHWRQIRSGIVSDQQIVTSSEHRAVRLAATYGLVF